MRTPLVLTITALACLTITYSFVRSSNIAFDSIGHADQVESEFKAAWAAGKSDEESREKLAWLCCETRRVDDARKIFAALHAGHNQHDAWSAQYSADFGKMAQVEICAAKFDAALRLYEEQLQYDSRFLPPTSAELKRDRNNFAIAHSLIAQTKSNDKTASEQHWQKADEALQQASGDGVHKLLGLQTALVLAQERGDRSEIDQARKAVEAARSGMKLSVPVVQF
jgi:hypothetical protein